MTTDPTTQTKPAGDQIPNEASSLLTSVQHLETTRCHFECQTRCQRILHAPHESSRRAIFDALIDDPHERFEKRAFRICHCCQWPTIYVNSQGKASVHLARCRDRLCPLCSAARATESKYRVQSIVRKMDAPRFMTLTMPASDACLRDQLNHLMTTFRELRSFDAWKRYVHGGVWSLELTYNSSTRKWHPHIHVIYDGNYFPQGELKALWGQIHSADVIVDVRAVHSSQAAGSYLAKYVSKVVELNSWTATEIRDYADAMHRRRTIHTFGSCHGVAAEADPDDTAPPKSTKTVGVWVIRRRMRLGDQAARRAAEAFASAGGMLSLLLADCLTNPVRLTGDQLTIRLAEASRWIQDLDPATAACWKPPRESTFSNRRSRIPDRSLTEPPWDRKPPVRL